MKFSRNSKKSISTAYTNLEDINDMEAELVINSPRSIEACMREGVTPSDLLYIPQSQFSQSSFPPPLSRLHYEFHETKRKELLDKVRVVRKKIINLSQITEQSLSDPIFPEFSSNMTRERVKKAQVKMIKDRCQREDFIKKDIILKDLERTIQVQKRIDLNSEQAKELKNRTDLELKLQEDRKREQELEKDLLVDKKNEYSRKNLIEKERHEVWIKGRDAQIGQKKKHNEDKAKLFYESMKNRERKIDELKKLRLEENDIEEKKKLELIILKKTDKQKEMKEKINFKYLKTKKNREGLKKEIDDRQEFYYEMKKTIDTQHLEKLKDLYAPKCLKGINGKIPEVSESILIENAFQRTVLEEKLEQDRQKFEKNKEFKIRKQLFQQQVNNFRQLKQSTNYQRIANKRQYSSIIIHKKFLETNKKIACLELNKSQTIRRNLGIHMQDEQTKHRLDKEIEKMSVFKNWSQEKLLEIIQVSPKISTEDII